MTAVRIDKCGLLIDLPGSHAADIASRLAPGETIVHKDRTSVRVAIELALPLRGGKRQISGAGTRDVQVDATLVGALRRAHRILKRERGMPVLDDAPVSQYDRKILRLAFLAPDIQRDILAGHQPHELSLERIRNIGIPLDWNEQREALGWMYPRVPVL